MRLAPSDDRDQDVRRDQYYTHSAVAEYCVALLKEHLRFELFQMVEPSAGNGSFLKVLPLGSHGYDVDPKYPGIIKADFITGTIESDRDVVIVGNPPFGKNSSMALRFVNHAARQASVQVIALILPRTFRKASIQNRIDPAFHLLRDELMPAYSFLFRSKPYDVPSVFQIWVRRAEPRSWREVQTSHQDFEFTTPDRADFAIQRVGARAGRVHYDRSRSVSSHYFIRGNVAAIMSRLGLSRCAADVAGNPSLAKSEIVRRYREHTEARAAGR